MTRILLIVLLSLSLNAYEVSDSLQIRTFANGDLIISDTDGVQTNLLTNSRATLEKNRANYDYSVVGAQLNLKINDYLDLMAQGIYTFDDHTASLKWLLLGVDLGKDYKLQLGKMRVPFMKYTQLHYMGYSYLWARPQLLSGVNGFDELYGLNLQKNTHINDVDIALQFTAGKAKHDNGRDENRWIYLLSTELTYEGHSLRASYGHARFKNVGPKGKILAENSLLKFGSIEAELHFDDLGIYAGFSTNSNPSIPTQLFYYGSMSYKFGNFTPYYLHSYTKVSDIPNPDLTLPPPPIRDGYEKFTIDAIGVRYDMDEGIALKAEISSKRSENNLNLTPAGVNGKLISASINMAF